MKVISIITEAEFEAEYLQTEWYKDHYDQVRTKFNSIVLKPDFNDSQQNLIRKQLLWQPRRPLLQQLPIDIIWQIVEISVDEFSRLLVIKESGWEQTFGSNKTLEAAVNTMKLGLVQDHGVNFQTVNNIKSSIGTHPFTERLICISLKLEEPFTIIEGNHRALAFQLKKVETDETNHILIDGIKKFFSGIFKKKTKV